MTRLRLSVAIMGGAGLAAALGLGFAGHTKHLRPFLILWAVLTPYWWYLEYRLWSPRDAKARADFLAQQALSRYVWLGGIVALVALLL